MPNINRSDGIYRELSIHTASVFIVSIYYDSHDELLS